MIGDWEATEHAQIQVRFAGAPMGYQARVYREPKLTDGRARCEKCRRVFVAMKDGQPWPHKCGDAPAWAVLKRDSAYLHFGTRGKAYAAGLRKLRIEQGEQLPLPGAA